MMNDHIIEIEHLVAKYGEKTVLQDVSCFFPKGKITVILGTSGCGKTTLLKNVLRLYQPESGSIRIFDEETMGMDEDSFNVVLRRVGMLFQNGALLNSISVFDNVAIPLEQHTNLTRDLIEEIVRVKLELVHLGHAVYQKPSELSGGMKKRAALARAIALDPDILFCDEPSAGLDPLTSASLDELILTLKRQLNMTIVVVTHELASIRRIADHAIFLENGNVLFNGTFHDMMQSDLPAIQSFFQAGERH